MLLYILSKTWYKLWVLKLFALCPQTWWAPTRQLGSGLFVRSFLAHVRWICGSLSELRHTAALLRFCVGGFLFTVPCGRSGAPMDYSTTARHPWCQVDTYHKEEMGWLQGGEVATFVKGQKEEAGGRRAGVQPDTGRRACPKDAPTVGCRWNQALLPWLQAALDRYHHCWADVLEGAERTSPVSPWEETGECLHSVAGRHCHFCRSYIVERLLLLWVLPGFVCCSVWCRLGFTFLN